MANDPQLLAVSHAAMSTLVIGKENFFIFEKFFKPSSGTNEWEVEGDVRCSAKKQVDDDDKISN